MKKLLLFLLLFAFLTACNNKTNANKDQEKMHDHKASAEKHGHASQQNTKVSKDDGTASSLTKEKTDTKTFMWKVIGAKSPLYLLGSIHAAKPELYPLNEKILNAYKETENLVLEVDIQKDQFKVQMKVLDIGMYKKKTLKDVLPADVYKDLSKRAGEIGLPVLAINKMKPWLASLTLVMFQMKKLGYDPEMGIDLFFLKKAKKEKKNIIELETATFQLDMLSGFSDKLNILNLKLMLKDWDKLDAELSKMFDQWKLGKTEAMSDLTTKYVKKYPEFKEYNKKILTDRNIDMTKKIDAMLKGEISSYFVIVGGGHLIGKDGIIELLRKKGYKVVQQ